VAFSHDGRHRLRQLRPNASDMAGTYGMACVVVRQAHHQYAPPAVARLGLIDYITACPDIPVAPD